MIAPIVRELVRYILPALSPASWSSRMICAGRCIGPPNGDEGSAKHQWEGAMNVYTIVLERIGTGEPSLSIVTRQDTEEAARAYAEAAIARSPDMRVVDIRARPYDPSDSSVGWHRAG
jgi:hypothetical protein